MLGTLKDNRQFTGLPLSFWCQAAQYATSYSTQPQQIQSKKGSYTNCTMGRFLKLSFLFSAAYRVNQSLGARAIKARYLGPSLDQKGFRIWVPSRSKIYITRHFVKTNRYRFCSNIWATPSLKRSGRLIVLKIRIGMRTEHLWCNISLPILLWFVPQRRYQQGFKLLAIVLLPSFCSCFYINRFSRAFSGFCGAFSPFYTVEGWIWFLNGGL